MCSAMRNKPFNKQSKDIIINVYLNFKSDYENNSCTIPVTETVSRLTGVKESTIKKIVTEYNKNNKVILSQKTKRSRKITKTNIDSFDQQLICRIIYDFHIKEKQLPTLSKLLPIIRSNTEFTRERSSLHKKLHQMGISWTKTEDNRKILVEKPDIVLKRIKYLRAIAKYREEGRPIIYTDETYIHSTHAAPYGWTDGSQIGFKKTISKGTRHIILHAGGEEGFAPNDFTMFRSGQTTGDYHNDMNYENYEHWLKTQLIPNLKPNSVIVIDNVSYHNVTLNRAPTSASKKQAMVDWLYEKNTSYPRDALKVELYDIIKNNKEKYMIDTIFEENGHTCLRLPPYHPELNPIEKIWASLKGFVASNNTDLKSELVQSLVKQKVQEMSDEWKQVCRHVKDIEKSMIEREACLEMIFDNSSLVFRVNGSGSELTSSSSDSD